MLTNYNLAYNNLMSELKFNLCFCLTLFIDDSLKNGTLNWYDNSGRLLRTPEQVENMIVNNQLDIERTFHNESIVSL